MSGADARSHRARTRWSGIGIPAAKRPFRRGAAITAQAVKQRARELGADLVGIANAAILNAFPPDPLWPQTPERISRYVKSEERIFSHHPLLKGAKSMAKR